MGQPRPHFGKRRRPHPTPDVVTRHQLKGRANGSGRIVLRSDAVESDVARVLNVLAHEIRTPLAASLGYLRLMSDGHLTATDDVAAAIERMRQALGKISTLCEDIGRLGAATNAELPTLCARVPIGGIMTAVAAQQTAGRSPMLRGLPAPDRLVATDGTPDLAEAVRVMGLLAFVDAGLERTSVDASNVSARSITVIVGRESAVVALPRDPDAPDAVTVAIVRGGFGVSLFWAEQVLRRHRVRSWQHVSTPGAIGMAIPLVSA